MGLLGRKLTYKWEQIALNFWQIFTTNYIHAPWFEPRFEPAEKLAQKISKQLLYSTRRNGTRVAYD